VKQLTIRYCGTRAILGLAILASLGIASPSPVVMPPSVVPSLQPDSILPAPTIPVQTVDEAKKLNGPATWYGAGLHGHHTANGERYDMNRFTAAHRELPFGSIVRVTNLRNGRSVVVRINDRGPLAPERMIDLSRGAAKRIGMIGTGIQRVHLDVIRVGNGTSAGKKPVLQARFRLNR